MALGGISPAADWDACGDRFYQKHELYKMAWKDVNLEQMRIACAPFGGPIALVRDESKIVLVSGGDSRTVVKIFTSAGGLLGAFVWDRGRIVGMGWTDFEELMIVEQTGEVHLYSMFAQKLNKQFSLGSEAARQGLLDCRIYGGGVVALTASFQLWAVANLEEPRAHKLADTGLFAPPHCMEVIPPKHTLSGHVEVLLATGDTVLVVDADSAADQAVGVGPILRLAVAPNGQFLAGFTADGRLVVWVTDFTKTLSEFATQSEVPPEQLCWCGTDSVVMYWEDILLMVGPYGDWVKYTMEEAAALVSEVDGLRIVSASAHHLLRRVPDPLVDVFRIGSTAPGALLYDARELFDQQNAKADETLRSIAAHLPEAVATCVDAAGADLLPLRQQALLKAACYGRAFVGGDALPKKRIIDVARSLRILNALRDPGVGLPLSMPQLEELTLGVLVPRLINGRRHLLALRIADMLNMGTEKVLVHWACAKISASSEVPDPKLRDMLAAKLAGCPGIRYATIAAHAQSIGRKTLAAMLLEYETCAAEQVPLLLSLGERERGLVKALESGDADLAYLAIFALFQAMEMRDFLPIINARPVAMGLFMAYASRNEPKLLENILMLQGRQEGVAAMRLRDAIGDTTALCAARVASGAAVRPTDLPMLELAQQLEEAANLYGMSKEHGFQRAAVLELARLRRLQAELEAETGQAAFLGLSLAATLRQCVRLGNMRAASRIRHDFRVSDKRFWWLKLRTLAAAKDWETMEQFAREKKSPIGWEPFIGAARSNGAPEQIIARFVARLPDGKRKAEEYAAIGMFHEAAETAASSKDWDTMAKIQGMVGTTSPLGVAVGKIAARLQPPK